MTVGGNGSCHGMWLGQLIKRNGAEYLDSSICALHVSVTLVSWCYLTRYQDGTGCMCPGSMGIFLMSGV